MGRNRLVRRTIGLAALLLVLILAVSVAFAGGNGGAPRITTLSGTEIVGGGDADGSGSAAIRLNVGQERVCWQVSYENIAEPFAAHIHKAPAGSNGGPVIPLSPIAGGCASADGALIQDIIDYPDQYYVNVHTPEHPPGAIRGQLSNPGQSK